VGFVHAKKNAHFTTIDQRGLTSQGRKHTTIDQKGFASQGGEHL
jgi:hypothetical protein